MVTDGTGWAKGVFSGFHLGSESYICKLDLPEDQCVSQVCAVNAGGRKQSAAVMWHFLNNNKNDKNGCVVDVFQHK